MKVKEMQKLLKRNSLKGRLALEVVSVGIEAGYVDNADLAGHRISALREKYLTETVTRKGRVIKLTAAQEAYNLGITKDIEFWSTLRVRVSKPRDRM